MYVSSPSMTLKCGSAKSFFIAAVLTLGSTSGATKREKSDCVSNRATSSIVGDGGGVGGSTSTAGVVDESVDCTGAAVPSRASGPASGARLTPTSCGAPV